MANKIKFGLKNVYYAKILTADSSGITYDTPVKIDGAVNLTLSAEGEETEFYADDVAYYTTFANNGYSGDLEIALIPDSFIEDILGEEKDTNGAYVENADKQTSGFALGYEVQGDEKPRRQWFYNCTVSRPNQDAGTKEGNITPQTDSLSLKAMPRLNDHKVRARMTKSASNESAFDDFFDEVYEPVGSSL